MRKSTWRIIVMGCGGAALLVALVVTPSIRASESEPKSPPASGGGASAGAMTPFEDQATSLYNEGLRLSRNGDFEKARDLFERANRVKKNDPDVLNMLAYTQRKTGRIDDAFENYGKALKLRPRFPRAHEYLAEAHLQAALMELDTLKSFGSEGAEDARQLVEAIRQAAATANAGDAEPATKSPSQGSW